MPQFSRLGEFVLLRSLEKTDFCVRFGDDIRGFLGKRGKLQGKYKLRASFLAVLRSSRHGNRPGPGSNGPPFRFLQTRRAAKVFPIGRSGVAGQNTGIRERGLGLHSALKAAHSFVESLAFLRGKDCFGRVGGRGWT